MNDKFITNMLLCLNILFIIIVCVALETYRGLAWERFDELQGEIQVCENRHNYILEVIVDKHKLKEFKKQIKSRLTTSHKNSAYPQ